MRRVVIVALVAVALAGALLGVATLMYRDTYGTWWTTPLRVAYCGRTYKSDISPDLSLAEVRRQDRGTSLPGEEPYPLVTIGKAPPIIGAQMWAGVTPSAESRGLPCTMVLYLETGDDSYASYSLSGGP